MLNSLIGLTIRFLQILINKLMAGEIGYDEFVKFLGVKLEFLTDHMDSVPDPQKRAEARFIIQMCERMKTLTLCECFQENNICL